MYNFGINKRLNSNPMSRGHAKLSFKTPNGQKFVKLRFNTRNLKMLESYFAAYFPKGDFSYHTFFFQGITTLKYEIVGLTCIDGMTEDMWNDLNDADPTNHRDNWKNIQDAFVFYFQEPEIVTKWAKRREGEEQAKADLEAIEVPTVTPKGLLLESEVDMGNGEDLSSTAPPNGSVGTLPASV